MTVLSRTKRLWIAIIVAIVFLYPINSTVVPSQNVLVITEDGRTDPKRIRAANLATLLT